MVVSSELGLSFLVSMQRMYSSLAVSVKDKQIQTNYTPLWIKFQVFELQIFNNRFFFQNIKRKNDYKFQKKKTIKKNDYLTGRRILNLKTFNFYYPLYKNLITFHGIATVKNENV